MLYIYGIGSQAQELKELSLKGAFKNHKTNKVALTIRSELETKDIESVNSSSLEPKSSVIIGVASPYYKKQEVGILENLRFSTAIASSAYIGMGIKIGEGSVIMPNATLTSNIIIGRFCMINIGVTISHDSVVGDYSTICPGVNIAGNCIIGKGVFVGIGSSISNNLNIADGVVIGAGSVVVDSLQIPNGTYVGCPAKLIKENDLWLKKV